MPPTATPLRAARAFGPLVLVVAGGRLLVTCWNDSSVHAIANGRDEQIIRHLTQSECAAHRPRLDPAKALFGEGGLGAERLDALPGL